MCYFKFSKSPRSRQLFLTKVSSFSTILRLVSLEAFQRRNASSLVNFVVFILYSYFFQFKLKLQKYLPSIFITKIHIPTSFESSDKNKGNERPEFSVFCSILRTRPIVVQLQIFLNGITLLKNHKYLIISKFLSLFIFAIFSKK